MRSPGQRRVEWTRRPEPTNSAGALHDGKASQKPRCCLFDPWALRRGERGAKRYIQEERRQGNELFHDQNIIFSVCGLRSPENSSFFSLGIRLVMKAAERNSAKAPAHSTTARLEPQTARKDPFMYPISEMSL